MKSPPAEKMVLSGLRLVRIETKNEQSFTNKRVKIHDKSNFVMLSGLVKTLFRTDNKGEITGRLWKRLEPKVDKSDHKRINDEIYISARALKKLVNQNSAACPKTWGAFKDDGLACILKEMGGKAGSDDSSESSDDSSDEDDESDVEATPSKKRKQVVAAKNDRNKKGKQQVIRLIGPDSDDEEHDTSEGTLAALNEILVDKREELLTEREEALDKRETILHNRERKCRMGELLLKQEAARLQTLENDLKKRESSVSQKDMNAFFDKISSLTNHFKHKVSRSRGGSPVRGGGRGKRAGSSPTPSGSDNSGGEHGGAATDKEENATAQTLAQMKAPSPIPSGSPSPADESTRDI